MLQVVTLMMSVAVSIPPSVDRHRLLTSPTRHVRAFTPELARILALGVARSATFARMMVQLESSDVIVQIVPSAGLKSTVAGRMLLVPGGKSHRFVRIEIRMEGRDQDLMTVVGHELRHALEVADAPEVRTERDLERLYRRIGHHDYSSEAFDTSAAVRAGARVRLEVGG